MKYSRNELNKAGYDLIGLDPFKRQEAYEIISQWRQTHLPVLRILNEDISRYISELKIPFEFASQRIKRMTSIEDKLYYNRERKMGLGGLQDIGGIRYVFSNIEYLEAFDKALSSYVPAGFTKERKDDYINDISKDSGYRSIHYVYQYHSEVKDLDGLKIELQIRTKLQHSWAMAVETASLISKTSLKAEINDNSEWRKFFLLASVIFAKQENKKIHPKYATYSDKELCQEYFSYADHKLIDQLKALRVTVDKAMEINNSEEGYCILIINFEKKVVHFQLYELDDPDKVSKNFTRIESNLKENEAALMVSMEKMDELRKAYPSYFLDTDEFINNLDVFEQNCVVLNYK